MRQCRLVVPVLRQCRRDGEADATDELGARTSSEMLETKLSPSLRYMTRLKRARLRQRRVRGGRRDAMPSHGISGRVLVTIVPESPGYDESRLILHLSTAL